MTEGKKITKKIIPIILCFHYIIEGSRLTVNNMTNDTVDIEISASGTEDGITKHTGIKPGSFATFSTWQADPYNKLTVTDSKGSHDFRGTDGASCWNNVVGGIPLCSFTGDPINPTTLNYHNSGTCYQGENSQVICPTDSSGLSNNPKYDSSKVTPSLWYGDGTRDPNPTDTDLKDGTINLLINEFGSGKKWDDIKDLDKQSVTNRFKNNFGAQVIGTCNAQGLFPSKDTAGNSICNKAACGGCTGGGDNEAICARFAPFNEKICNLLLQGKTLQEIKNSL